jgi:hypothetical protein
MKVYFAGEGYIDILCKYTHCRKLTSYLSKKEIDQYWKLTRKQIFLDSGAFSAFTIGSLIDINEYVEYIKKNKEKFEVYATLDVIGDYEATERNTRYMQKCGLQPLPVFHYKSPVEYLEKLVNEYDYIALGGLVPLALKQQKLKNWLDFCFSIIRNRVKVHGFGVNALWAWERYPFYSVDATSWLKSAKFGEKSYKDQRLNRFYTETVNYRERVEKDLLKYSKLAKDVTKLWEKRGIVWD